MSDLQNIAWIGEMILLEAKWNDKDGHLVKFKIAEPDESKPNPFKAYTKRRGGRAGTRFRSGVSHVQGSPFEYNDELMLAGWGDTSTQGYTVTFWCEPPNVGMHPFQGYTRGLDSFMVALVELDDNEEQIDQQQRERVENAMRPRRRQTLSQAAAMLCGNPQFWEWIETVDGYQGSDSESAAVWMRERLGIESRRELDSDHEKAQMYHEMIRKPFVRWSEGYDT